MKLQLYVICPEQPDTFGIDQVVVVSATAEKALEQAQDMIDGPLYVAANCEVSELVADAMCEGRPHVG